MVLRKNIFLWGGLIFYTLFLFIILTYYRLPVDRLAGIFVDSFTRGKSFVRLEKTTPSLLTGYTIEEVSYGFVWGDRLVKDRIESLTLKPDYLRLFTGYLPFSFRGNLNEGHIRGKAGISLFKGVQKGYFTIHFSGVRLEGLHALNTLTRRNPKGLMEGKMELAGNLGQWTKADGKGRFHITEGSLDTEIGFPGLKRVSFDRIGLAFRLENGVLSLEEGRLEGPLLSGELAGEMRLAEKVSASRLNILAKIVPGPEMKKNGLAGQFLDRIRKGDNPIPVRIEGPLENPRISLSKG